MINHKIYVLLLKSNHHTSKLIIQSIIFLALLLDKYIHHIKVKKQDHVMEQNINPQPNIFIPMFMKQEVLHDQVIAS